MRLPAPETVTVTSRRIACDGDDSLGLGHPRVWLAIPPETGFVDCGYCDKRFVLDPNHAHDDH
ncbi:zinc-finger domain-containing protein [Paracoccus onubensis]|uniref:Zinc-finger domain-containing protein n=1 Tax=Paracoccus onubensis TaxID=1675788 RepID=A0A418SM26_9RHOB|nr:zinc-finger domain-containing protein [Paracoccus onubensis]RJE81989.1 zinc-finger domain-containing protein [Paracoccus onubensis]